MHKKTKKMAFTFGQWQFVSLAGIVLSTFPIAGISENFEVRSPSGVSGLLASQVLHINCNGNVEDQSDLKHFVENEGVSFVGGDRLERENMACFFDGSDYLKISNHPAFKLSNLTIAAWVSTYGADTEKTRSIVSNYNGGGDAQHYGINMSKGVAAAFYDDGVKLNGAKDIDGTSLTDKQWHHVAAVFEGGVNTKLYVDGILRRQTSGTMPATITPTGDLYIGRGGSHEGMEERWRGSIDEVRIINRVLSEDQINLLSATIDLPTGETFMPTDPTGENENAPFLVNIKKNGEGVGDSFQVTPNSDGSLSINTAPSNTRGGVRDGSSETTLVIKNGEMTLIDEALPGVVATINIFGDLEITDANTPDLKLILQRNSEQFAFQSRSNPSVFVKVNANGSLDIIDETQPDIKAIRDEQGNIRVIDEETNTEAVIDGNGNAVITHPDFPNIKASFNVYDTDESYTLTNTLTNECIEVPADSNIRRNVRGIFSSIGKVFKKGISKIKCFFKCRGRGISSVVGKVVKSAGKFGGLASKVIGGIGKYSGLIGGVFGIGSTIIQTIFGNKQKKIIKRLEGQVRSLQGQVHTLQATIQQQDGTIRNLEQTVQNQAGTIQGLEQKVQDQEGTIQDLEQKVQDQEGTIQDLEQKVQDQEGTIQNLEQKVQDQEGTIQNLEKTVAGQAQTIQRLETTITKLETIIEQQAAIITQQAETIATLNDTVTQQKQTIDKQAELIASLEKRIADLENRTRKGNEGAEEIPDGDPAGGARRSLRDRDSNECRSIITPAMCQLYGIQDQDLNDSIAFVYNPTNKTVEQIGDVCQGCDIEAMAIDPNTDEIYLGSGDNAIGHPNGHLYMLDASTGVLRSVGVTGFNDISGLTFDDNGTLWGWAKGDGLVILNTQTGQGHLESPSSVELADLSWDSNYQVLYGVVGKELWSYDPTSGEANKLCGNLPRKTEAIKALPAQVSPAGLVWLGSHNNNEMELQAYEIATCQPLENLNLSIRYDDIEGLSIPTAACQ